MDQVVDKLILLPRYSSFAGAGRFVTAPINVRVYGRAIFAFQVAATLGSPGATVAVQLQQSPDLEIWRDIGSPLSVVDPDEREFLFEWIRLVLDVAGTEPALTCWCVGDFVHRRS